MTFPEEHIRDVLLPKWKHILRLQDWNVIIRIKRKMDVAGRCYFKLPIKSAVIEIIDPIDAIDWDYPLDQERVLIHELLHLHFAHVHSHGGNDLETNGSFMDDITEQAIELIADGLVKLSRRDDNE